MPSFLSWLRLGVVLLFCLPAVPAGAADVPRPSDAPATGTRLDLAAPDEVYTADQYRLAIRSTLVYRIVDEARFRRAFADTQELERRLTAMARHSIRRAVGSVTAPELEGPGADQIAARIVVSIDQDTRRFGVAITEFGFLSISHAVPR